jgi:hypothetical protein
VIPRRHALVVAAILLLPVLAAASTRYDPRLRFRTLSTPRFDIHFHQGEEALAQRLAVIAESVATALDATLGPPSGRVQVILVAQNDLSNGWATPLPYNTIEITAPAPAAGSAIGNTTDWLSLVFTHEYTHIVHLSRGSGWIGGLRRAFGRVPVLFPNLYLPVWQIEGIATYQETATTHQGRLRDSSFRSMLDVAAGTRFEGIDRVNGGLVDWPGGNAPYLYGAHFHGRLAEQSGAASLRQLTDETAARLPFLGAPAFKKVYGRSLGDLWKDYEAASARPVRPLSPAASRLTHHGFVVGRPRFGPDGRVYYSIVNPHGFPALMAVPAGGGGPVRVANQYLGASVGFRGGTIVFDQLEVNNHVGLQSDLFEAAATGGAVRRLTHGARAAYPDVAPDGATVVCTMQESDRRALALVRVVADGRAAQPDVLISEPGVHFASPRWSPNGRWIAVERGQTIVIVDPAAKRVERTIASSSTGRLVAPAWAGNDTLLFASDRGGAGFQVHRIDLTTSAAHVLEGTGPDARSAEASADGRTLVFVGYTAGGFDLFSLPADQAAWTDLRDGFRITTASGLDARPAETAARIPSNTYTPWRTIAPRFWTPTVFTDSEELFVGAATGSADALGRHAYAAQGAWTTSRTRPDLQIAYAYDRWWPTFFGSLADDTDPWRGGERRTREANAGLLLPFRRVRWSQAILGAVHSSTDEFTCDTCAPQAIVRRALRGGWQLWAARGYGYSISLEEGWSATATTEITREAWGSRGNGVAMTVDTRGYLPVWPRHAVIAARGAAALTWGDDRVRRVYSASGDASQPGGFRFGSDAVGLLRGLGDDEVIGGRAAVINLDYRAPLLRIDRGWGTVPFFARVLHGAAFVDIGHAWSGRFKGGDATVSVGGELSLDAVIGFRLPVTVTTGAAWVSHDRGFSAFGRIGRAF